MSNRHSHLNALAFAVCSASVLTACGGGGGGGEAAGARPPAPAPAPVPGPMTMSCVDGPSYQCSGSTLIRSDNGVALTSSGVQAYGRSTSDLATPNPSKTTAFGFALASGGLAELRLSKDANGVVSAPALLLSNLGLSWDRRTERPLIIETFRTTQGRTVLNASGALTEVALPPPTDLSFYDVALRGMNGTQANYANNRYFPRSTPSRCPAGMTPCPTTETAGPSHAAGTWRTGGPLPDVTSGNRVNSDGDVHAGNAQPAANGSPRFLPGGDGPGVPFPGTKGYRNLVAWSLQHGNLGTWTSEDTVEIHEWGGIDEHTKNRRGVVAFGAVTDPKLVPSTGSATYNGFVHGYYAANGTADPSVLRGTAIVTVNFTTRMAIVTIQNTVVEGTSTALPVALNAVTAMGTVGGNETNYMTGAVDNGTLRGGLSARFFGPIAATGTSGTGPAEIGGVFSLSNTTTNAAAVAGFIARKQ